MDRIQMSSILRPKKVSKKPTLTRAKPPRKADTYRGARRNYCRAQHIIWARGEFLYKDFVPNHIRQSYISKKPSKYIPHDGGKSYIETIKENPKGGVHKEMYRGFNGRNR